MPRKRGVPRWGSNWYARKEQRQRKEQLERALVIATSMLRQRARAEEKALLSTIAEKETGCSNLGSVNLEEQLNSGCIVEEDLTLEDLSTMAAPSDRVEAGSGDGHHTFRMDADLPGCIIEEETPWQRMDAPFVAENAQGDVKQLENRSGRQEDEFDGGDMPGKQMENRSGGQEDEFDGGDMHGFLSREEHLSLLFELRGHMADLEHRAHIMGQRLDVLFDAHSDAPTLRSLTPSRLAPRGRQTKATGHQFPRVFMFYGFRFMLLCLFYSTRLLAPVLVSFGQNRCQWIIAVLPCLYAGFRSPAAFWTL